MIDFDVAKNQLLEGHECRLNISNVTLAQAANRILAEDLYARYPSPMFDNSAMDGYAVCDEEGGLQQFAIVNRIQAGQSAVLPLNHGEAARIFTGAPLPNNTTAVVMQEQTEIQNDILLVSAEINAGQNMRLKAEEIEVGQLLLEKGSKLNAASLGLAASQGYATLPVFTPLKVLVVSTGNELLEPGKMFSDGHIYDANRYQLMAWLQEQGMDVVDGGIVPDNLNQTETILKNNASQFDVIITSGGASVGEADYLKQAIVNIGSLTTHSIAIKPGKPFAWGRINQAHVFILPGNPVAAFVTAHMLLLPVLSKLSGKQEKKWHLPIITAKAAFQTNKAIKRREFLRVSLGANEQGETTAILLPNQGSAMLSTCVAAEALCEVKAGEIIGKNDYVKLHLLS